MKLIIALILIKDEKHKKSYYFKNPAYFTLQISLILRPSDNKLVPSECIRL